MPSRKPRSATRTRLQGHSSCTAARIAAPASTTAASLSPLPPSFSVRPLSPKQRRELTRTGSVTLAVTAAEAGTVSAAATAKLAEIERDQDRAEFVLLVSRGGETAVLRVKLK